MIVNLKAKNPALVALAPLLCRPQIAAAIPRMHSLPAMPAVHQKVLRTLNRPDFNISKVEELLSQDIALTAQILKVANSALFRMAEEITSVGDAVQIIGSLRLRALVSSAWAFKLIDKSKACPGFDPQKEWDHAFAVAIEAQQRALLCRANEELTETAFTAGMLHDIGKVVMATDNAPLYAPVSAEVQRTARPQHEVETEMLGYNHAELGGCLLGLWGLPFPIVQAVGWHHDPSHAPEKGFNALTLVHLANCEIRKLPPDPHCVEILEAMS